MEDRVGQQLGNYRLIRLLGTGGFGSVYLGEHIHLGSVAAIKVLYTQMESETRELERFRTEARTIANLLHPNIVRILDFGIEKGTPFLVMDYVPNGTLRQKHARGIPLPLNIIVSYTKQIASALQYAHNTRLIHRDVKPDNMLVRRQDEIVLSDFGIAVVAHSTRSLSTQDIVGTPYYMAPEQIMGRPLPASDQYALGIVVYEWLTGEHPFKGSNFVEIVVQQLEVPPPSLREKAPEISPAVEQVVMKALSKRPEDRYSSVLEFAHALEQAAMGGTAIIFPTIALQAPQSQKQPQMGESIVVDAGTRASHTGEEPPQPPQQNPPTAIADPNICPICGKPIQAKDTICLNCGIQLPTNSANMPTSYGEQGTIGTRFIPPPNVGLDRTAVAPDERSAVAPALPKRQTFIAPPWGDTISAVPPPPIVDENAIAQLMQEGEKFYKAKLFEDALKVYNRIIALDPRNVAAHGYRGNALGKLQFYREALAAYETALKIDARHVSILNAKGDILVKLGKYEEAISTYEEALKLSPKDVLTWFAKASVFVKRGRYEEAVNAYTECLNFSHRNASIWVARGNILAKLQRNEEALDDYNAALKLNLRNGAIWEAKGKMLAELQSYEDAFDAYTKATALLPKKAAVWVARSDVLAKLERYNEALADCEHAQILNPKDRIIEKQCAFLRKLMEHKEKLAQAQVKQNAADTPHADQAKTRNFSFNTRRYDQTKDHEERSGSSKQTSDNARNTKRFHVFLSHAPEDMGLVKELAERLEDRHSFQVWFGEWMKIPGESWQQAITKGLQQSHCCAICIGAQTPIGWFGREMEWALAQQSKMDQASANQQGVSFRVIPVLLPNAPPEIENEIDEFLKQNMLVDFRGGKYDFAFHALAQGVKGEPIGRWPPIDNTSTQMRSFAEDKLRELHGWVKEDIVDKSLSIKLQETILIQYWLPNDDTEGKGK